MFHVTENYQLTMMNDTINKAKTVLALTVDAGKKATSASRQIAGEVWDKVAEQGQRIWPEVTVPVFLLPTGSQPDEVYCLLDFDDIAFQFEAGHFAHPRLEIWCGRSDIAPEQLAAIVQEALNQYLAFNQSDTSDEASSFTGDYLTKHRRRENHAQNAKIGLAGGALFALTGLWNNNPTSFYGFALRRFSTATLIFLAIGTSLGIMGAANGLGYLFADKEARQNNQSLRKAYQSMNSQLNIQNQQFIRAVRNLRLKVHPTLHIVASEFCHQDHQTLSQEQLNYKESPPPVKTYLKSPMYLNRLTPSRRKLVHRLL